MPNWGVAYYNEIKVLLSGWHWNSFQQNTVTSLKYSEKINIFLEIILAFTMTMFKLQSPDFASRCWQFVIFDQKIVAAGAWARQSWKPNMHCHTNTSCQVEPRKKE